MAEDTTKGRQAIFYGGNHYGRVRDEDTDVGGASGRRRLGMV